MGELRAKRPPSAMHSLGRSGAGDERLHRTDEESIREEMARLRTQLAALRREGAEAKERLRAAERDSTRKDKLLQELLATAKGGTGVPGEALDQLREDLQALLQVKRRSQEARQQLDEKELKIMSIQQELKSTSLLDMEEDVAAAKLETKAKAEEWAKANAGQRDTQCFAQSQQHQQTARELYQKVISVENEITRSQQRLVTLQDERARLEQAAQEHEDQVKKLLEKREEIERQKEQCEERLDKLGNVAEQHARMKDECDKVCQKLAQAKQEALARELESSARQGGRSSNGRPAVSDWRIDKRLLEPGFQPLPEGNDSSGECRLLLQLLRVASEVGQVSLLKTLRAEDSDGDGLLTSAELATVLNRLASRVTALPPEADLSEMAAERLISCLSPGLAREEGGTVRVAIADLALTVPLQPQSFDSGPSEDDLYSASQALAWACRRCSMPEREARRRMAASLQPNLATQISTPSASSGPRAIMAELAEQIGLGPTEADVLGRGLESQRERLAFVLPSWRCLSQKSQASLLVRFVHDLTMHRDALVPQLGHGTLELDDFVKVGQQLGAHWCREDLEEVALLVEPHGRDEGRLLPVVDAARLCRAVVPGGFACEFPKASRECTTEAREACEASATMKSRPLPAAAAAGAGGDAGLRPPAASAPGATPFASTSLAKSPPAQANRTQAQKPTLPELQATPLPPGEAALPAPPASAAPAPPPVPVRAAPTAPPAPPAPPSPQAAASGPPPPAPPAPPAPPPAPAPPAAPGKESGSGGENGGDNEDYEEEFDDEFDDESEPEESVDSP